MTYLDNICEYFIWWPNKDKDPNTQKSVLTGHQAADLRLIMKMIKIKRRYLLFTYDFVKSI
jgi:hypothetical protein